jgi:hypothetical protein
MSGGKPMSVSETLGGLCVVGFFLLFVQPLKAQDLDAQTKALRAISAFAAETCGNPVAFEGTSTNLELSGDIKAQLQGLVAQVAAVGMTGAGKYKSDAFKNVLHEQLAEALKDNATCRLKVFELLQQKMVPQH